MMQQNYIERVVDLTDPARNTIFNMSIDEARDRIRSGDSEAVRGIDGHFALVAAEGKLIRMARSLSRPLRYFIAKQSEGPCLVVAERIDTIYDWLQKEGFADQFHPSYTRMVPAHYITEIALLGCPDPNPQYRRFFTPQRNALPADVQTIGERYIAAVYEEIKKWLRNVAQDGPIGVSFSGGIDSGSVFLLTYHALLELGMSPSRLKAFTLSLGEAGADLSQARRFLEKLDLGLFLEEIIVSPQDIDWRETIRVVEDYKPLDIQSAAMNLALLKNIRRRYPDWRHIIDGDGGDENLKDYPIEENPELTIKSVLNNLMLYHEGWGVDSIKHSLTYSGGLSRGYMRTWAPAAHLGFQGFSPYTAPAVIEIAEGIPFIELTQWDHEKLYSLKGEIVRRGVKAITSMDMPVFEKRRFQHGATADGAIGGLFPKSELSYRRAFSALYEHDDADTV